MIKTPMIENASKIIKAYFPSEIRRFKVKSTEYLDFLKLISEDSSLKLVTQYLDDEEEWVTFSTTEEWNDALNQSNTILRVKVSLLPMKCGQIYSQNVNSNFFDFHFPL